MALQDTLDRVRSSASDLFSSTNARESAAFLDRLKKLMRSNSKERMTITPMMAEVMLTFNTGNRVLSKTRCACFASDMKKGNWQLTGEPIIFSKDGILNDGQTRLHACIQAGVPFASDVTFGIERRAFEVTGVGGTRTLADVLGIQGEVDAAKLSGAVNWLNRYDRGVVLLKPKLTHADALEILDKNPNIRDSVSIASRQYANSRLMPPSLAVFLHYIFSLKDKDAADAFFDILATGLGYNGRRDPRYVLRERLIANANNRAKIKDIEIAALCIKAWNLLRGGKQVQVLRWQGPDEEFPRAV